MLLMVAVIIVIIPFALFGFLNYKFSSLEKETRAYLLESYVEEDIIKIESGLGKGIVFVVSVVFKDEQDVVYEYTKKDGKIIQIYPYPEINNNFKHIENR